MGNSKSKPQQTTKYHLDFASPFEYSPYTSTHVEYFDVAATDEKLRGYKHLVDIVLSIQMTTNKPQTLSICPINDKFLCFELDCKYCAKSGRMVTFGVENVYGRCSYRHTYPAQIVKIESFLRSLPNSEQHVHLFVCSIAIKYQPFFVSNYNNRNSRNGPVPKNGEGNMQFITKCNVCDASSLRNEVEISVSKRITIPYRRQCSHMGALQIDRIENWMKYRQLVNDQMLTQLIRDLLQNVPSSIIQVLVSFARGIC
eukprot:985159_1